LAIVITQPCSLRSGIALRQRLLMGLIKKSAKANFAWNGNYGQMVFKDIFSDSKGTLYEVDFENIGSAGS